MTKQEAQASPDVVTGTFLMLGGDISVLLNQGLHNLLFHVDMLHKLGWLYLFWGAT